jgi:DNA-binding CsgD family transcriptional regulator
MAWLVWVIPGSLPRALSSDGGQIVLGLDWRPESLSPGVEEWLRDLPDGNWAASRLPTAVLAVAARAARSATSTDDPSEVAVARVLTRSGRWVVLHGVPLVVTDSQRVAVIVEPAHPSRIAPLLMSAYGLTKREQQLTRLVLQGYSTLDIADHLVISVHTVQGHLRNIFTKTGVRARRDLVTKIFFAHYEPRLRDNEQRTAANKQLRGGPAAATSRTAAPARHRLSRQPRELRAAQREDPSGRCWRVPDRRSRASRRAATHSRCAYEANPDHDSTPKVRGRYLGLVHQSHAARGSTKEIARRGRPDGSPVAASSLPGRHGGSGWRRCHWPRGQPLG